ncbi:MaoC/PaaZ C-terminal domain-containing protein [Chelativorans sp. Marseille-P2723]|uniref:MaoC family dehydratase n=1 Tax=Chelativorans sp. Marseille-P2723 TaxID=2709133 RepID=UPI00156FB2E9|nr:MaoC/PaaZ C-terminal domain-containing protein [Chelativorans sp. Marseille-P2723]
MTEQAPTLWLDDFKPGQTFSGGPRTINERDLLFCALWCGDGQPHSNEEYSRNTPFGRRIVHGDGTLAMGTGLILGQGMFAGSLIGYDSMEIRYPNPVFIGDAIRSQLTIETVEATGIGEGVIEAALEVKTDKPVVQSRVRYLVKRKP